MDQEFLPKPEKDWPDHELVPISALEHYSYCPRQAALIHMILAERHTFPFDGRPPPFAQGGPAVQELRPAGAKERL